MDFVLQRKYTMNWIWIPFLMCTPRENVGLIMTPLRTALNSDRGRMTPTALQLLTEGLLCPAECRVPPLSFSDKRQGLWALSCFLNAGWWVLGIGTDWCVPCYGWLVGCRNRTQKGDGASCQYTHTNRR